MFSSVLHHPAAVIPHILPGKNLWLKSATELWRFLHPLSNTVHTDAYVWALAVCTIFNVYDVQTVPKNLSLLSLQCLLPTPIPSISLLYPPISPPTPSSLLPFFLFCPPVWSVAPQGEVSEVLGQINGVQAWLSSVRLCFFTHSFPSPSLPLCINSYSMPPFLRHSFFPTVLYSHLILLFSMEGPSISSALFPRVLFSLSLPLFSNHSPLCLNRLIVFLSSRKTYKDLSLPWQH